MFGVVVHEDVVSFLRIGPQIKELRHSRDVFFRALPPKVAIDGQAPSWLSIVSPKVEDGLEPAKAYGTWT
jgi:hypothetical protein